MATGDSTTSVKPFRGGVDDANGSNYQEGSTFLVLARQWTCFVVGSSYCPILPRSHRSPPPRLGAGGSQRQSRIRSSLPCQSANAIPSGLLICRHPRALSAEAFKGLRITTRAETLLAAARDLGLLDLVILGDSALHLGHCTLKELQLTAAQRRRGAPQLPATLPLLDQRSESPRESVMRVLHVAAGIQVEPQKKIYDSFGRFVAGADL